MTKKIFRSIFAVALTVFLCSVVVIMGALYGYYSSNQMKLLGSQVELASQGVELAGVDYLKSLTADDYRVTLIDSDGSVEFDSAADSAQMENHLERKEIKDALKNGEGQATRYSSTLMERQLYSAKRLSDGRVLRLSCSQYTWWTLFVGMLEPVVAVFFAAVGLSLFLAFRLSKRIVEPLNKMDFDGENPPEGYYEELSPLVSRIESQKEELKYKEAELKRRKDEFNAATKKMTEGLVLLNENGKILSINDSASKLLSISSYCVGKDILLLNNSFEMQELIGKAKEGRHCELIVPLDDADYEVTASPVMTDGKVTAIALLIVNITEREKAEQMRREFTANVSHELKTPLQTISGCAELMQNGLIKPEDVEKFGERIYSESKRMITLVEDIIGLSRLDDGTVDTNKEPVNVKETVSTVIDILKDSAQRKNVTVSLSGNDVTINTVKRLLSEVVYNLCDNAVKYNKDGGRVDITIKEQPDFVSVTVADTGIGIPGSAINRVFERFYRVDKSHSKEVGGTGLGLSIVKHAVKLLGGDVSLESEENKGTSVTVTLPKI